jgi:uroporphyrinogen-III synthase
MILITRPKKESLDLKKKIELLGYETIISPLSYFKLLSFNHVIPKNNIILISSPRAANIILSSNKISKSVHFLIIGNSSFKKLKQEGFKNIIHVSKDSDEMYKYVNRNYEKLLKKNSFNQILYFTGSISSNIFLEKDNHINIKKVIIYETKYKGSLNSITCELIHKKKIKVCLVYSQANARHLIILFKKHRLEKLAKQIVFLSLSKNIAQILIHSGFKKSLHARQPTQKSLLLKLSRI